MIIGPVFTREAVTAPRRPRFFALRGVYVAALLLLLCTAWLVVAGTQVIRNVGDMARFGGLAFQMLAPLQLAVLLFLGALSAASAVALEKDRKTLILLLMTRLGNHELVLGKLTASLLPAATMLLAGLPLFMSLMLLGGVSAGQVFRVYVVSLAALAAAGSLGNCLAFWREKTFQTLALSALALVFWIGACEALAWFEGAAPGLAAARWATAASPFRAVLAAASPAADLPGSRLAADVGWFVACAMGLSATLSGAAIALVRVWNPTRETQGRLEEVAPADAPANAAARPGRRRKERPVWDNPVLWREVRTWAYGRKVLVIRLAYWLLFALAAAALHWLLADPRDVAAAAETLPRAARVLAPFCLVSWVLINALAVNSITNERDNKAIDLLLATDLTPREFLLGKLGGVLWLGWDMLLAPLALCGYCWWRGGVSGENCLFLAGGFVTLHLFSATLGAHCGLNYASSRTAIGISLGVLFFLFLGVAACIMILVSFSGSFSTQFMPFVAFMVGGGIGLYVALGARNPSRAITLAAALLPIATFFALTGFLLGNQELSVFLVVTTAYGFTTAAMLIPPLSEFDIALGRAKTADE